ncbi:hypothetical protein ACFYVM_02280 [Streptomyces sp. NPDC003280]|uniref:hypothetical protein n=1 Tax=Streptomyces sp. NPDC003280 TaxID=3364680 RepID=UPI0036C79A7B
MTAGGMHGGTDRPGTGPAAGRAATGRPAMDVNVRLALAAPVGETRTRGAVDAGGPRR